MRSTNWTAAFIRYSHAPSSSPSCSVAPTAGIGQLIFTTHDTNLLDVNLLSRDSIWFVEKDAAGASSLYALSEFKGAQLEQLAGHLEQGYLQGRFGAIPFFG